MVAGFPPDTWPRFDEFMMDRRVLCLRPPKRGLLPEPSPVRAAAGVKARAGSLHPEETPQLGFLAGADGVETRGDGLLPG